MRVVASDAHRSHDALEIHNGAMVRSSESPERADIIAQALRSAGHEFVDPTPVEESLLNEVHSMAYTQFLRSVWERWEERGEEAAAAMGFVWPTRGMSIEVPQDLIGQLGYYSFAGDTTIVDGTWQASMAAASIAMTAADYVSHDGLATYGLCRPPGHHAMADQFGGYCYINNAAVAAQRLRERGAGRVAVLDVDYHHGNGTQSIFYERSDVLFVSIHGDPRHEFPWFSGHANEIGHGEGHGWNVNLPLAPGSDFATWSDALDHALLRIQAAHVDALVVSLGVDTYENDPLGTFTLATTDFAIIAERVGSLGLPTVLLQEGGYAVADLGHNVATFLEPLSS
jgi:acetoin utilization deacetylase AcuC-like enzyme